MCENALVDFLFRKETHVCTNMLNIKTGRTGKRLSRGEDLLLSALHEGRYSDVMLHQLLLL